MTIHHTPHECCMLSRHIFLKIISFFPLSQISMKCSRGSVEDFYLILLRVWCIFPQYLDDTHEVKPFKHPSNADGSEWPLRTYTCPVSFPENQLNWLPVRVTLSVGLSTRDLQSLLALYETTWQLKMKRESSGIKVYPQLSTNAAIHACHEPRLAISKSFLCGIGFISYLIPRLVYCENYNLRGINDVESGLTQQHQ